jgi:uncharacterized protein YndB with AHSA1/START domain
MTAWFCHARPHYSGRVVEMDLRAGGAYRLEVKDSSNGRTYAVGGKYIEILPPERLAFTWVPEHDRSFGETVVEIEFLDRGELTEIILKQGEFPAKPARDAHEEGWVACFAKLGEIL